MNDTDPLDGIDYRPMRDGEAPEVCDLVRQVFDRFIAHEFGEEGRREFFRFVDPGTMQERVRSGGFVLVASRPDELMGMLEFTPPDRIAMLFVLLPHRGIGRALLDRAVDRIRKGHPGVSTLTVHSSRYAEPSYRRMGFRPVGAPTTENGITYIPMTLDIGGRPQARAGGE